MKTNKELILVINNGSTSTKLAIYQGENLFVKKDIIIAPEDVKRFSGVMDQRKFRLELIEHFLSEENLAPADFSIVATQAGALPGIKSGAYLVNELMIDVLERFPTFEHAANLGCAVAFDIAQEASIPAIIYDGNTTDEMIPMAKLTGISGLLRIPTCHVLNTKSVARAVARKLQKPYEKCSFVIAHIGGGVSLSAHRMGQIVDDIFDDEGPMAPQRAGLIPACQLIDICYSGKYSRDEMQKLIRGKGGLLSLTGSQDAREIEAMIAKGDENAKEAYHAMAYQIAKGIGSMATVFSGKIDRIILTGGIAHSKMLTDWIIEQVSFIAPVEIVAGENEMESLGLGALRILRGEENARTFDILPPNYVPKQKTKR